MKPSAPKKMVWGIALIVGILGIVGHFVSIAYITEYNYWFLFVGFVLLALGTSSKNM